MMSSQLNLIWGSSAARDTSEVMAAAKTSNKDQIVALKEKRRRPSALVRIHVHQKTRIIAIYYNIPTSYCDNSDFTEGKYINMDLAPAWRDRIE